MYLSNQLHFRLLYTAIRVENLLFGFLSESLVFCKRKSKKAIFSWIRANRFCKEQWERITHGRSFVLSDRSDSLTVAILSKRARTNEQKSKFPTLTVIPSPWFLSWRGNRRNSELVPVIGKNRWTNTNHGGDLTQEHKKSPIISRCYRKRPYILT